MEAINEEPYLFEHADTHKAVSLARKRHGQKQGWDIDLHFVVLGHVPWTVGRSALRDLLKDRCGEAAREVTETRIFALPSGYPKG